MILTVVFMFVSIFAIVLYGLSGEDQAFSSQMDSYIKAYEATSYSSQQYSADKDNNYSEVHDNSPLRLIGKPVIIENDGQTYKVSEMHQILKNEGFLVANNSSDVDTIIVLYYHPEKVGTYTDGESGLINVCEITLINNRTKAYTTDKISGKMPPQEKMSDGSRTGPNVEPQVKSHLEKLLRDRISVEEYNSRLLKYQEQQRQEAKNSSNQKSNGMTLEQMHDMDNRLKAVGTY